MATFSRHVCKFSRFRRFSHNFMLKSPLYRGSCDASQKPRNILFVKELDELESIFLRNVCSLALSTEFRHISYTHRSWRDFVGILFDSNSGLNQGVTKQRVTVAKSGQSKLTEFLRKESLAYKCGLGSRRAQTGGGCHVGAEQAKLGDWRRQRGRLPTVRWPGWSRTLTSPNVAGARCHTRYGRETWSQSRRGSPTKCVADAQ